MMVPLCRGTSYSTPCDSVRDAYIHPQFVSDVIKPLNIEALFDQEVQNLSGGELQRVAITLCLGTPADIYLIDEPSAYLDSEQRILAAKVRPECPYRPPRSRSFCIFGQFSICLVHIIGMKPFHKGKQYTKSAVYLAQHLICHAQARDRELLAAASTPQVASTLRLISMPADVTMSFKQLRSCWIGTPAGSQSRASSLMGALS
eukprot:scaffold648021_cov41-Prasinocladus_malaysianus.AAC.1